MDTVSGKSTATNVSGFNVSGITTVQASSDGWDQVITYNVYLHHKA